MSGRRRGNRYLQHPLVRGFVLPAAPVAATVLTATAASADDGAGDGVGAPATVTKSVVDQDTDSEMDRATNPQSAQQLNETADPPSVGQPATVLEPDDGAVSRVTAPAAQPASSEAAPPPSDPKPSDPPRLSGLAGLIALVKPSLPSAGRWGISNDLSSVTNTNRRSAAGSTLLLLLAVLATVVIRRTRGVPQAALGASGGATGRAARVNFRPG